MRRNGAPQPEQPQPQSSNVDHFTHRLIDDREIVDLIFTRPELFEHRYVLDQPPDGENGDGKMDRAGQEERELGEGEVNGSPVQSRNERSTPGGRRYVEELSPGSWSDQRRVLQKMTQDSGARSAALRLERTSEGCSLVAHPLQAVMVDEPKVASMDDGSSLMLPDQAIEFVVCAEEDWSRRTRSSQRSSSR